MNIRFHKSRDGRTELCVGVYSTTWPLWKTRISVFPIRRLSQKCARRKRISTSRSRKQYSIRSRRPGVSSERSTVPGPEDRCLSVSYYPVHPRPTEIRSVVNRNALLRVCENTKSIRCASNFIYNRIQTHVYYTLLESAHSISLMGSKR